MNVDIYTEIAELIQQPRLLVKNSIFAIAYSTLDLKTGVVKFLVHHGVAQDVAEAKVKEWLNE